MLVITDWLLYSPTRTQATTLHGQFIFNYPSEKHWRLCKSGKLYVSHTCTPHPLPISALLFTTCKCLTDLFVTHSSHTLAHWLFHYTTRDWCFKVIQYRMKMAVVWSTYSSASLLSSFWWCLCWVHDKWHCCLFSCQPCPYLSTALKISDFWKNSRKRFNYWP